MASLIPKHVKKEITEVWVAETWYVMLLDNTHVPDASQENIDDVSAKEIPASGPYIAGGVPCGGALKTSVEHNPGVGEYNYYLDCPDIVIGPLATLNWRTMVLYEHTGNPANSRIRAQIQFAADQEVSNGTCTIKWNALGIIYIT